MIGPLLPIPRGQKGTNLKGWSTLPEDELVRLMHGHRGNVGLRLDRYAIPDPDSKAAVSLCETWEREGVFQEPTWTFKTARGIVKRIYKRPAELTQTLKIQTINFELRAGAGFYDVLPPSYVKDPEKGIDGTYAWLPHQDPQSIEPAPLPAPILKYFLLHSRTNFITNSSSLEGCNDLVTRGQLDLSLGGRDSSLFHIARSLFKGGMAREDAEQVIKILAKNCSPAFSEKNALAKIESAFKEERILAQEIREWLSVTGPLWTVSECDKELGIVTDRYKANRRVILHRLVAEGVIARVEGRPGTFRIVEKECFELDFLTADTGAPQPIKWPFELEKLVDIYRKNLVIVAGSKDSGKTGFMLNVVRLNMNSFPVVYLSSEMAAEELALRLSKFGYPLNSWKFKAYERASNFADAIEPDALNIIDFYEIADKFYLIAGELRKIYDKLRNGMAVIAIQKDDKAEVGRGKSFSMEKARMYLTLDNKEYHHELKIVSGKNWAQEGYNPQGKVFRFKLVDGCRFMAS